MMAKSMTTEVLHAPEADAIAAGRLWLAARDPALARMHAILPPFAWRRRPGGFAGLMRLITEQQVSTASAQAIWSRLESGLGGVAPDAVLSRSLDELRAFGLSLPKARYALAIAEAFAAGGLGLDSLAGLDDEDAIAALTALRGVGRWTAEIYLLFCEARTDVFPAGDLALQEGLRLADGAAARLSAKALSERAEAWRPHRGLAAHMIWAYYAAMRARRPGPTSVSSPEAIG